MEVHYPDHRYECLDTCGKCCSSGWRILLDPEEDGALIEASQAAAEVRRQGYVPLTLLETGERQVTHNEKSRCVFLDENDWCELHKELGARHKPRICQQFPYQPVKVAGRCFVGLSFRCVAVQQNLGAPMSEQAEAVAPFLQHLLEDTGLEEDFYLTVIPGKRLDWSGYVEVESRVYQALRQPGAEALFRLCLELAEADPQSSLAQAEALIDEFTYHFLAMVECPYFVERRREVTMNLLDSKPFFSEFHDAEVDFPRVFPLPDWHAGEAGRFLEHLVFRKQLCRGPLVARLLLLLITRQMLTFYTFLSASRRQAETVEPEDIHYAFERLESSPYLVSEGARPLLEVLEEIFLEHFRPGL